NTSFLRSRHQLGCGGDCDPRLRTVTGSEVREHYREWTYGVVVLTRPHGWAACSGRRRPRQQMTATVQTMTIAVDVRVGGRRVGRGGAGLGAATAGVAGGRRARTRPGRYDARPRCHADLWLAQLTTAAGGWLEDGTRAGLGGDGSTGPASF